jgi:hypothetical protein
MRLCEITDWKIQESAEDLDADAVINNVATHTKLSVEYLRKVWDQIYGAAISTYKTEKAPGFSSFIKQHFLQQVLHKSIKEGIDPTAIRWIRNRLVESKY